MRHLTIVNVAFPFAPVSSDPVGGAEQVVARLDRALVAAGHRSIVIAADGSATAGELVSVPQPQGPIAAGERASAHAYLQRVIPEVAQAAGADLIHMHGLDYHAYLPPPGIPVLATLHLPFSFYEQRALQPVRPRTWVNYVSHYQQRHSGSSRSCLAGVIENGVRAASHVRHRQRCAFAFAMGRICHEKGFHLALDAAKAAAVPLKLAGQVFPYREHQRYFEEEIRPRLDDLREWIGPVSGARKWRLLCSARCLLAPSLVEETASLVAREALAAGTPVIAFPKGALADTVEHGRTGFLVGDAEEMASAILRCDAIDRETCRRTALTRFSLERMIGEYFRLYERLCDATDV